MVLHGWTMAAKILTEFLQKVGLWFCVRKDLALTFASQSPDYLSDFVQRGHLGPVLLLLKLPWDVACLSSPPRV